MAIELGSALESALRELVRQVVREEFGLSAAVSAGAEDAELAELAVQRAAKLRRARSKGGAP